MLQACCCTQRLPVRLQGCDQILGLLSITTPSAWDRHLLFFDPLSIRHPQVHAYISKTCICWHEMVGWMSFINPIVSISQGYHEAQEWTAWQKITHFDP